MIDREELERLHEAATSGPWEIEEPMDHELWLVEAGKEAYQWRVLAGFPWPDGKGDVPRKQVQANANLLAYLRNAVPDILKLMDERDALAAENAALTAKVERLEGALKIADDAISEMFRYYDGGEMRGSYDGKPERNQLRKAGYVTRAALKGDEQ